MSIPKGLQPYIEKGIIYACIGVISFFAMFAFRIAITASLTPIFGEENANELVGVFFLTSSQIIFNQYGIGIYSILLVGAIAYFSKKNQRKR